MIEDPKKRRAPQIRNVSEGDRIPSTEILKGMVVKQTGRVTNTSGISVGEYWLERIPNTEGKEEFFDVFNGTHIELDCAVFEIYFKDPGDEDWMLAGSGPLPIDEEAYDRIDTIW